MKTWRLSGGNGATSKTAGTNHPGGVLVHFYAKDTVASDTVSIVFKEMGGELIKTFSTHPDKENNDTKLEVQPGLNRINWDMRYKGAKTFPGMILWSATTRGPLAVPGEYQVSLSINGEEQNQTFEIMADPRSSSSQSDLQEQFDFLIDVRDKLSEANQTVIDIRKISKQIKAVTAKVEKDSDVGKMGKEIIKDMKLIEEALYQTKNESRQDPLNYPIRLNNKVGHLGSLAGFGTYKPTDQAKAFFMEVSAKIDEQTSAFNKIVEERIGDFNQSVLESKIEAVKLDD